MIRQHIIPRQLRGERYFHWRGGDVSRIEGLSDGVFAFALTLLVVSLEVPDTFDQLKEAFLQIPAFAVCFAFLILCWYYHYRFHRRYGLETPGAAVLNACLLFVILVYVYPLKFLATYLFNGLVGVSNMVEGQDGVLLPAIRPVDMDDLMLIYALGFTGIFALFAVLNWMAWRKREELGLDELERYHTRIEIRAHLLSVLVGLLSVSLALIGGRMVPWAGIIFFLMGPVHGIHGWLSGARLERMARERLEG